jgi:GWxTD domain-containing protein
LARLGQRHLKSVAAALLLAAFAGARPSAKETRLSSDDLIKRWADGPVRYLMTSKEDATVRGMKTVPELAKFISEFWARRDPTPGTFENQFRRVYWGRVLEAERRYRDSTTPGWKTDRGKIFIMLGAPDDVQTEENPSFSAGLAKGIATVDSTGHQRGIERWTYHSQRAKNAAAEFIVAFVKDESLDWKLSTDPSLIEPTFPGTSTVDASNSQFGGIEARPSQQRAAETARQGGASTLATETPQQAIAGTFMSIDTSLFANYDLGLEQSVPTTTEEVIATVTTKEFLSAFPARVRFEFYRAADGSTFVNVGAVIKADDLYAPGLTGRSGLRLYASVTPAAGGGQTRYAANDAQPLYIDLAKGPAPGGVYDVWTGLALNPGAYRVTLAIEDSLTGRIGRTAADLDVPDLSRPGLRLSTLVLASGLSDMGSRLGVTPRSSATYRKSETLGIYYEVYGLPGGEAARFKTSYRFFREMPGGAPPSPIGKPIVFEDRKGAVQGWSFPLAKWPVGRFRMEVTVTGADNVSASDEVAFEVIE